MGKAMNYFQKKLLGYEIFRSMVSWARKRFLKTFKNPSSPTLTPSPTYIINRLSLMQIYIILLSTALFSDKLKLAKVSSICKIL